MSFVANVAASDLSAFKIAMSVAALKLPSSSTVARATRVSPVALADP